MTRVGTAIRPGLTIPRVGRGARIYFAAAFSSVVLALFVDAGTNVGPLLRLTVAGVVALLLITVSLARPAAGVIATFIYLIFLAFLRRLLIPAAGWLPADPMILVPYVVVFVLIVKLYFLERRPLAPDLLSKLMLALLAFTFLEVANPTGAGVAANLTGLLYMALPLLWFFVGRAVVDDALSDRILGIVLALGIVIGAYGVYQTQVGDPPWDVNWLNVAGGYNALHVGNTVRAWGTFSSSGEYALFVGSGLAIAFAYVLRGRTAALLGVPVLAVALFLSSGRSALILSVLAIVVMLALRTHRPRMALIITVCAIGAAYGGLKLFGSTLSSAGSGSSALVSHQLGGIANPLDPNSSTLLVHVQEVITGFKKGFTHPEGNGPGSTNQAAGVNHQQSTTQQSQATEVDISNAFVSLGIVGGILYLAIVLLALGKAVVDYFAGREALLPVIGVLVVGAGQWLTGGNYALSALSWLLVGTIAAGPSKTAARRPAWEHRSFPPRNGNGIGDVSELQAGRQWRGPRPVT